MTSNQAEFMRIVAMYDNIADNGNLMAETGWGRRKVAAIGRGLVRKGLVTYAPIDHGSFEGGVYTAAGREGKESQNTR